MPPPLRRARRTPKCTPRIRQDPSKTQKWHLRIPPAHMCQTRGLTRLKKNAQVTPKGHQDVSQGAATTPARTRNGTPGPNTGGQPLPIAPRLNAGGPSLPIAPPPFPAAPPSEIYVARRWGSQWTDNIVSHVSRRAGRAHESNPAITTVAAAAGGARVKALASLLAAGRCPGTSPCLN